MCYEIGVGTDIELIERFKRFCLIKDANFLNKIYTKNELEYCFSKKDPSPHLAARFCAKEAVVKALNNLNLKNQYKIYYNEIEIIKTEFDVPEVVLNKENTDHLNFKVSLSHSINNAIAFAVVIKKEIDHMDI